MEKVRSFSCHLDSQNLLEVYRNSYNLLVNLTVSFFQYTLAKTNWNRNKACCFWNRCCKDIKAEIKTDEGLAR